MGSKEKNRLDSDLVLGISITEFEAEEIFKWFAQCFVEVKVGWFVAGAEQSRHDFMDAGDGLLRNRPITVTGRLHKTHSTVIIR